MLGLTTAATAVGNRRARGEAERLAAPQWHPLGEMPILATNERLLVWHEYRWESVWLAGISHLLPSPAGQRLELLFDDIDDPPYALWGPWVPYLTVLMSVLLEINLTPTAAAVRQTGHWPPPALP